MHILLGVIAVVQMLFGVVMFGSPSAVSKAVAMGAVTSGILVLGFATAVWHLAGIKAEMKKANALREAEMTPEQIKEVKAGLNPPWYAKRAG